MATLFQNLLFYFFCALLPPCNKFCFVGAFTNIEKSHTQTNNHTQNLLAIKIFESDRSRDTQRSNRSLSHYVNHAIIIFDHLPKHRHAALGIS